MAHQALWERMCTDPSFFDRPFEPLATDWPNEGVLLLAHQQLAHALADPTGTLPTTCLVLAWGTGVGGGAAGQRTVYEVRDTRHTGGQLVCRRHDAGEAVHQWATPSLEVAAQHVRDLVCSSERTLTVHAHSADCWSGLVEIGAPTPVPGSAAACLAADALTLLRPSAARLRFYQGRIDLDVKPQASPDTVCDWVRFLATCGVRNWRITSPSTEGRAPWLGSALQQVLREVAGGGRAPTHWAVDANMTGLLDALAAATPGPVVAVVEGRALGGPELGALLRRVRAGACLVVEVFWGSTLDLAALHRAQPLLEQLPHYHMLELHQGRAAPALPALPGTLGVACSVRLAQAPCHTTQPLSADPVVQVLGADADKTNALMPIVGHELPAPWLAEQGGWAWAKGLVRLGEGWRVCAAEAFDLRVACREPWCRVLRLVAEPTRTAFARHVAAMWQQQPLLVGGAARGLGGRH